MRYTMHFLLVHRDILRAGRKAMQLQSSCTLLRPSIISLFAQQKMLSQHRVDGRAAASLI